MSLKDFLWMLFLFILFVELLYAIHHTYTSILKTILNLIIFEFSMNVAIMFNIL